MTLPTDGVNPWRSVHAHTGMPSAAAKPAISDDPARLSLDGTKEDGKDGTGGKEFKMFGDDGPSFLDLVDVINPLQHIPVISTFYREATGDTLNPAPRIVGDTLFLGPIGLASSVANVWVEYETGKDIGDHVLAYFKDEGQPLDQATQTAAKGPATAPVAAGTDGEDPVSAWAREQNAFYAGKGAAQPTAAAQAAATQPAAADPVTAWATAQHAYYQDPDARAATRLAAKGGRADPVTADPVTDWARQQTAYYAGKDTDPKSAATQVAEADPVSSWAREQTAYYAGKGTTPLAVGGTQVAEADPVSAWAREQTAYYAGAGARPQAGVTQLASAQPTPVAAGTDGVDPVAEWAKEQIAFYNGTDATPAAAADPVTAWARQQTAFYRQGDTVAQTAQRRTALASHVAKPKDAPVRLAAARPIAPTTVAPTTVAPAAGGTDGTDPVADWARAQTAFYRGEQPTPRADARPAARPQSVQPAQVAEGPIPRGVVMAEEPVVSWAQEQLAWVHGDRAKEMAASGADLKTADRNEDKQAASQPKDPGAIAENGGWFQDKMLRAWTKYNAAQQLANPGYRPDLSLSDNVAR